MTVRVLPQVRPPFVATKGFLDDFPVVHGFRARCCYCGQPIRPGEVVAWGRAWKPQTVHHPQCKEVAKCA